MSVCLGQIQRTRQRLRKLIREFFEELGYCEVETPCLVRSPGTEAYLDYFGSTWSDFRGHSTPVFLRSSPELHMKRLLAESDLQRIFQFAPCFRNHGEFGEWHHPEFTMLEWYQTELRFGDLIKQTQDLIGQVFADLAPKQKQPLRWHSITLKEAFRQFAGIELIDLDPELGARAQAAGCVSVNRQDDFETAFSKVLIEKIEPELKTLSHCILYDYPASQAALAKVEGGVAKRFEAWIDGIELCNGFWELTDPAENRNRIEQSNVLRQKLGKSPIPHDEDFYRALAQGLEDCSGNALGIDRLLALALGQKLDHVVPFRTFGTYPSDRYYGSRSPPTAKSPPGDIGF